ncbi:tyrosine-protein phosphatase [Paraliobacillus sediminis]|uniref:tyrosine-protein phosphatase n=1 Tax=Paraliobacillus sediminis TaxID=1885916 RepID=UPI000E3B85DA|nr:CpsB/CapC family capsule biosynthesis tyrosine phosphatase [Paraliobacillus sediminis]
MIDMHGYILPGVDGGTKHTQESIAIAKAAVDQGIDTIIATPKYKDENYDNFKEEIIEQVNILNQRLQEERIALTVLPGQEIRIYGDMLTNFEKEHLLTLNETTEYVLIELPKDHFPSYITQLFYDLQIKGYKPIISHPEINSFIREDPDLLYNLVKKGALTQLASASVVGKQSKKVQKFAFQLIESNLAHFIGSEVRSSRNYIFRDAITKITKQFGEERTFFFIENANSLIDGNEVIADQPLRIKKKGLGIFRKT